MRGKRKRIVLLAGGMVICMSAVLAGGIKWSQARSEKSVVKAAAAEIEEASGREEVPYWSGWVAGAPYREVVEDQEIVKQVCDRYGLDYKTVTMGDITREMRNYEEALELLKTMGDKPLLEEYASDETEDSTALNSLEVYISEVYAFGDGKKVIEGFCKDAGIRTENTLVSEMTAEQLVEIGERAYNTSDHPKGFENPEEYDPEVYKYLGNWTDGTLYRDVTQDQNIVKQVCEKYGLDYEHVTMSEITREMMNYEEALELIKKMGDRPLLEKSVTDRERIELVDGFAVDSSLEFYISEVYAFNKGAEVIEQYCKDAGIDPGKATISDLTVEQLIDIGELAYNTSDHPKE